MQASSLSAKLGPQLRQVQRRQTHVRSRSMSDLGVSSSDLKLDSAKVKRSKLFKKSPHVSQLEDPNHHLSKVRQSKTPPRSMVSRCKHLMKQAFLERKLRQLTAPKADIMKVFDHTQIGQVMPTRSVDRRRGSMIGMVRKVKMARLQSVRNLSTDKPTAQKYADLLTVTNLAVHLSKRSMSGADIAKRMGENMAYKRLLKSARKNPSLKMIQNELALIQSLSDPDYLKHNKTEKLTEAILDLGKATKALKPQAHQALVRLKILNETQSVKGLEQLTKKISLDEAHFTTVDDIYQAQKTKRIGELKTKLIAQTDRNMVRNRIYNRAQEFAISDFFSDNLKPLQTALEQKKIAMASDGVISVDKIEKFAKMDQLSQILFNFPEAMSPSDFAKIKNFLEDDFIASVVKEMDEGPKQNLGKLVELATNVEEGLGEVRDVYGGGLTALQTTVKGIVDQKISSIRDFGVGIDQLADLERFSQDVMKLNAKALANPIDDDTIREIGKLLNSPVMKQLESSGALDDLGGLKEGFQELRENLGRPLTKVTNYISKEDVGYEGTNWELIKSQFLDSPTHSSETYMKMALDYRFEMTKQILKGVGDALGVPVILQGKADSDIVDTTGPHTVVKIVGSNDLSSDIDVNITVRHGDIGMDTEFITECNMLVKSVLQNEFGNDSDVNFYNEGVFPDVKAELNGQGIPWGQDPHDPGGKALRQHERSQHVISLIKVKKFAGDDWEQTKTEVLRGILGLGAHDEVPTTKDGINELVGPSDALKKKARITLKRYQDAEKFVVKAERKIASKKAELRRLPQYKHLNDSELELAANNRLYEEEAKKANRMLLEARATGDLVKLARAHDILGRAHYFANEAALSVGVLKSVVVNGQMIPGMNEKIVEMGQEKVEIQQQIEENQEILRQYQELVGDSPSSSEAKLIAAVNKKLEVLQLEITKLDDKIESFKLTGDETNPKLPMSESEILQAFNENFGDSLKEINHHSEEGTAVAAYRSVKYLGRAARDMEDLLKKFDLNDSSDLPDELNLVQAFITKVKLVEGYGEGGVKNRNLLAIRKDRIGGSYPLKPNPDEGRKLAKSRLAEELMVEHGFMTDHTGLALKSVPDFKADLIAMQAQLNAYAMKQMLT